MTTKKPETDLQPTAHHPLGPSTLPMLAECIDYQAPVEDPEDLDVEDDSPKGRGTVKHKSAAMLLAGDLRQRQKALEGLDDRERDEVQYAVSKAIEIVESNGYSASEIRVEQRVTLLDDNFNVLYFGTEDGEVGPIDLEFKFGLARNYYPQLCGYALPKMEARGEGRRFAYTIYGKLKFVEKSVIYLETAQRVVRGLIARRASPHRKPTPCQYCNWCAKRAVCSAITPTAVSLVERREDWAMKLPSPHPGALQDPLWAGVARYIWKQYLEPWGKAVEFGTSSMASNKIAPVGFRIQEEKGRASISDTAKAFALLKATVGEDVLWDAMSLPIGKLATAFAKSAGVSEDKAKALIRAKLAEAKLLEIADPIIKLMPVKNGEDVIRAAIETFREGEIPIKVVDPRETQIDVPPPQLPEGTRE